MAQNTTDITATTNVLAITWGHAVYLDMQTLYGMSTPNQGTGTVASQVEALRHPSQITPTYDTTNIRKVNSFTFDANQKTVINWNTASPMKISSIQMYDNVTTLAKTLTPTYATGGRRIIGWA